MKSASKEDYLRIIFELSERDAKNEGVHSVDIAKALDITKASTSNMIRKLSDDGCVIFEPYSTVKLTAKGKERGKMLLKKHFITEVFLNKVLGYRSNEAHEQAHELEHSFTDESIDRLEKFLREKKFL